MEIRDYIHTREFCATKKKLKELNSAPQDGS